MRWWAAMQVLAGCGRLAFDPIGSTPDAIDSTVAPFACPGASVPDPLTISGKVFRYTNFTNGMAALDMTSVAAFDLADSTLLGGATSDAAGLYSFSFPTNGTPTPLYLSYFRATYLGTYVFFDGPVTGDLIPGVDSKWNPGEGPLWQSAQMDMIYAAANVPRQPNAGAINVGIRDCTNQPIEGVEVTFEPPPGAVRYQDDAGMPSETLMTTGVMFGHVLALNPQVARTRITASKNGLRFTEVTIDVTASTNNLVLLHGGP